MATPSVMSLYFLTCSFANLPFFKMEDKRGETHLQGTLHLSLLIPAKATLVVKWPQSRSWRSGRSGNSLTFIYPPGNQHIPPGGKETHLQKCLWLWIRYRCSTLNRLLNLLVILVGKMAIPTAHLLIMIRTSWLLMIADGSNPPLQWNNFFCSPPKSKQSMGMIISQSGMT